MLDQDFDVVEAFIKRLPQLTLGEVSEGLLFLYLEEIATNEEHVLGEVPSCLYKFMEDDFVKGRILAGAGYLHFAVRDFKKELQPLYSDEQINSIQEYSRNLLRMRRS